MIIPFVVFHTLPFWDVKTRTIITTVWLGFLLIDGYHIMTSLKRDEREYKIEAIAERNAAWVMVLILVLGLLYQVITSAFQQRVIVDWFLVAALLSGAFVKTISNIYLEMILDLLVE